MTEEHEHPECPYCGEPFVSILKKEEGTLIYCRLCTLHLRKIRPDLREALKVCADGTSRKSMSQRALQLIQRLKLNNDGALGMPPGVMQPGEPTDLQQSSPAVASPSLVPGALQCSVAALPHEQSWASGQALHASSSHIPSMTASRPSTAASMTSRGDIGLASATVDHNDTVQVAAKIAGTGRLLTDFGLHSTQVGHGLQVAGAAHEAGAGNILAASQPSRTPCPKPSHAGMTAPAGIGTITGSATLPARLPVSLPVPFRSAGLSGCITGMKRGGDLISSTDQGPVKRAAVNTPGQAGQPVRKPPGLRAQSAIDGGLQPDIGSVQGSGSTPIQQRLGAQAQYPSGPGWCPPGHSGMPFMSPYGSTPAMLPPGQSFQVPASSPLTSSAPSHVMQDGPRQGIVSMQTALRTATYAMHVIACALPDLIAGPSQGAAAAGLLPHDPYGSQSTALGNTLPSLIWPDSLRHADTEDLPMLAGRSCSSEATPPVLSPVIAVHPPTADQRPRTERGNGKGGVGIAKTCVSCSRVAGTEVLISFHCCECYLGSIGKQSTACSRGKKCTCAMCISPKTMQARAAKNARRKARRDKERVRYGKIKS